MGELVTEARVEWFLWDMWTIPIAYSERRFTVPEALEVGRYVCRRELMAEQDPEAPPAAPVRVIDAAGVVVAQWGRP